MSEYIEFRASEIHGMGGFARKDIPEGVTLIEYVGQKIDKQESSKRCESNNEYIFYLDEDYDLDGNVGWNPAKFINHSCTPNCEAQMVDKHIWIIAKQPIKAGQEITFNYGYDFDDYQDHPCRCGSPECVGYIVAEEYLDEVRQRSKAKDSAS